MSEILFCGIQIDSLKYTFQEERLNFRNHLSMCDVGNNSKNFFGKNVSYSEKNSTILANSACLLMLANEHMYNPPSTSCQKKKWIWPTPLPPLSEKSEIS